jgi:hypothetical protein
MQLPSLRTLLGSIGLFVVVATCLFGPVGYFLLEFGNLNNNYTFRANLSAARVSQFAYLHPAGWQFQEPRLAELIETRGLQDPQVQRRIIGANDQTLVKLGTAVDAPVLTRAAAILVAG